MDTLEHKQTFLTEFADIAAFLVKQVDSRFPRSVEFLCGELRVYLRAGPTFNHASRDWEPGVTIANVSTRHNVRQQGHFRTFLRHLEKVAKATGFVALHVELVGNEILRSALERYGYARNLKGMKPDDDMSLVEYHYTKNL
ncbi:hypothetical protein D3C80_820660 [compost metagenome]